MSSRNSSMFTEGSMGRDRGRRRRLGCPASAGSTLICGSACSFKLSGSLILVALASGNSKLLKVTSPKRLGFVVPKIHWGLCRPNCKAVPGPCQLLATSLLRQSLQSLLPLPQIQVHQRLRSLPPRSPPPRSPPRLQLQVQLPRPVAL